MQKAKMLAQLLLLSCLAVVSYQTTATPDALQRTVSTTNSSQACNEGVYLYNSTDGEIIFTVPDTSNYYISCSWRISGPDDKLINVRFISMNIPCSYYQMYIYNGYESVGSSFHCGTVPPRSFTSTRNFIRVVVSGSRQYLQQKPTFHMKWNTTAACQDNEFRCWSGKCIPQTKRCDESRDCDDDSDEITCAQNSTQADQCGRTTSAPGFTWTPRVVGGDVSNRGAWPWQVKVQTSPYSYYTHCGGTVIDKYWILTSATCVQSVCEQDLSIQVPTGRYSSVLMKVEKIQFHEQYNSYDTLSGYNIALLRLAEPITFSSYVRPVCLSNFRGNSLFNQTEGMTCIATGFGHTNAENSPNYSNNLNQVRLPILDSATCLHEFNELRQLQGINNATSLPGGQFCAGHVQENTGTCEGDQGGPLVCLRDEAAWYQVGIAAFRLCAEEGQLSFFTDISYFSEWINNITSAYNIHSCGSTYIGQSGKVSSPNYPLEGLNNFRCQWTVIGPSDHNLVILFDVFELPNSYLCSESYVEIYDGNSTSAQLVFDRRHCGIDVPPPFEASSNTIIVIYNNIATSSIKGFSFRYTSEPRCNDMTEFRCWDGSCIAKNLICDDTPQCDDGSDEIECAKPSTADQCGTQTRAPAFQWAPRIVGGSEVVPHSYPWQVMLARRRDPYSLFCSGSIIAENWVLTAAHCVDFIYSPSELYLYAGKHNSTVAESTEQKVTACEIHLHENYDSYNIVDDIALVKIRGSFEFNDYVRPICIERLTGQESGEPPVLTKCVITGWGYQRTTDRVVTEGLRQAITDFLDNKTCNEGYQGIFGSGEMPDTQLCAGRFEGGISVCNGDSGGPMICLVNQKYWHQVGIVSYGSARGCALSGLPGFFTRVSSYVDWIDGVQKMNNEACAPICGKALRTEFTGNISSPDYPLGYPQDITCRWEIQAPYGLVVYIDVSYMLLYGYHYSYCRYDYMEVYDGSAMVGGQRHCSSSSLDDFESQSNNVTINFRSSYYSYTSSSYKFLINYQIRESVCGDKLLTNETGNLTSPGYPLPYPTNTECRWVIKSAEDKVIEVEFLNFDIYNRYRYNCIDYLQVFDGSELYTGKKFCGSTVPRSFAAYSSNVTIVFSSGYRSSYYNNTGFHLSWKTVDRCLFSEHTCWNGTCIPDNQQCDGVQHCNDNSDEIECDYSTANLSECGKPSIAPEFTWDPRIIGGSEAKPGSWPWQVGLSSYRGSSNFYCGGSIINEQWVVTAASCVNSRFIYVNYGLHSRYGSYSQTVRVVDIRIPEQYSVAYNGSNIALLKVETSFKFTNTVRTICLPDSSSTYDIAPGTYCIATGWGYTDSATSISPSSLHQVRLPIISNEECAKAYGNQSTINDAMICAGDVEKGGIGPCQLDFGGPLACLVGENNWNLIGISSFGSSCQSNYPGVYTRVSSYADWIQKAMTSTSRSGVCNSTTVFGSLSGNITSPGYPGKYFNSLDCRWSIIVPEPYLIVVRFREFSLEASYRCQYDYVNIYIGSVFYTGRSYCRNRPGDFMAESNNVTIVFHSDIIYESSGFLIEWTTEMKCSSGNFKCWSGECLDGSTQCNGVQDCSDNSDEIECSHSTFNHSQCGKNDEAPEFAWDPRIAGGSKTSVDSWPWQASIYSSSYSFSCGGSMVNDRWVISSADCVQYTFFTYYVRVGRYQNNPFNNTGYSVDNVILHPLYISSYSNLENNIALLRTSSQMIFSSSVRPVCLPSNGTEVKLGMHCIATGWGALSINHYEYGERQLYQVRLPILNSDDCTTYFTYNGSLNDGLMCGGYWNRTETGTCFDDEGGPLVCLVEKSFWVQMGVATRSSTCSMSGRPSVFVRTDYHRDWISEVLARNYTTVTPSPPSTSECEGTVIFTTPSGTVASPGYPSNYASNLDCEWTIVTDDDRVIEIIFNEVILESQSNCNYDYLEVYDGQELYNGRKFCGSESLRNFAALSTSVRIVFHTDSSVTRKGFSISWTTSARCQDDEYTCGNGACIPENQQCDGLPDCDAGDDEEECVHVSWNEDEDCGKVTVAPTFTWDTRIVGGNEAVPGSYPWMAMLRYKDSSSFICGASIINNDTLLTAAHCVEETTRSFQVVVGRHEVSGSFGEQIIDVKSIIIHANYSENNIAAGYDIAILKLEQRIVFNGTVRPVCLPRSASGKYEIKTGKQCIATGWGALSENHIFLPTSLFQVRLPIIDQQVCMESYSGITNNNTICAGDVEKGGIDTCQGDSGGPLVCLLDDNNWYQIGITSFGFGCARSGKPGVYTTVSHYYQWIVNNIGEPPSPESVRRNSSEDVSSLRKATTSSKQSSFAACNGGEYLYGSNEGEIMFTVPDDSSDYMYCYWRINAPTDKLINVKFLSMNLPCSYYRMYIYNGYETVGSTSHCGTVLPRSFTSTSNFIRVSVSSSRQYLPQKPTFHMKWNTTAACQDNEFRCWSGKCIPQAKRCDESRDCEDDSDEITCAQTWTEADQCGMTSTAPGFTWTPRVVGGSVSNRGAWPWQVKVQTTPYSYYTHCGGTVIDKYWILTSATCVQSVCEQELSVQVSTGRYSTESMNVEKVHFHKQYNNLDIMSGYNIALLRLAKPITFSSYVRPVCLSNFSGNSLFNQSEGMTCIATGFGQLNAEDNPTYSSNLQQVRLPVLDSATCLREYNELRQLQGMNNATSLPGGQFCAGHVQENAGTCKGDHGGPLVCLRNEAAWYQVGIAAFRHCSEEGQPSFFTDISYFSNWINNITSAHTTRSCGSTHTGPSGKVSSPNYPFLSPLNVQCQWKVTGPSDHNLVIVFDVFELSNSFFCSESYLEIYDGNSTSAQLVFDRRHCGIDVPPPFEASSNTIIIVYNNIASSSTKGFSFRYTSEPRCNDVTQFRCWDGTCIAKNFTCDDIPQCDDGSDEIECAKPSTPDQCGTQATAPAFQWAPRIVGGSEVIPHSYPWQVMIARRRNPYSLFCSGSIIAENWVLTAAHCVDFIYSPSELYLYAGKHNSTVAESTEQKVTACEIHIHEDYDSYNIVDDIALVKIRESFEFNGYVRPICIERLTGQESGEPPVTTKCVITGWGRQRTTDYAVAEGLRQAITDFLDNKTCNEGYQGIFGSGEMPDTQLCAGRFEGGISVCNGDSGGPMICLVNQTYWHQVGIVSYGSARGCALPGRPGFFTRVSNYVDWIDRVQKRNSAICAPICGKALRTAVIGNITSPDYPLGYPPDLSCRWEIQAPYGLVVHVDVSYLLLYGYSNYYCPYDYVEVYDGDVLVGGQRHCSSSFLNNFESQSNNVTINFRSSYYSYTSSSYRFLINYQIRESVCGDKILTNETGKLTSPGFPLPYPTNTECRWVIKSPEDKVIEVEFLDFDIYNLYWYNCIDYLQVFDGSESYTGNKFCGTTAPRSFAAYSSNVTILFSAGYRSSNYNNTGFHLSWKTIDRCLLSEHTCWNGTCIPGNQQCDGVQHCNDNSDEIECGHPAANVSECGKPTIAPHFTWDPRIFGGNEAKPGSWPWQVGLSSYRGSSYFYCGGSIINEQWVVTAASCVSRWTIYVNYGLHSIYQSYSQSVRVIDIQLPGRYFSAAIGSNIALLKVETSFTFTNTVRTICLPDNSSTYNIAPGTYCIATGWGYTDSGYSRPSSLHQVRLPIISNAECAKAYGNQSTINDAMICAGDVDKGGIGPCRLDFGGPLACLVGENKWNLIGISSFGSSCQSNYPGVYTRVSSYADWIQKAMSGTLQSEVCNSTTVYTSLFGNVTSPGYPGNYFNSLDCRWSIIVPESYSITLRFREFSLEESYRCQYDYVSIYDGHVLYTGRSYCRNRPGDFLAASNNVTIVFHSDFITQSSGFLIEWTTELKCPSGNFSCWSGECLEGSTQCNGIQDCSDNSDEIECSHSTSNHSQCGKNNVPPDFTWDPRIAGGSEATVDSWPWQASIYRNSYSFYCGGSVLNERWVMSSADCVRFAYYSYYIRVGRYQNNPYNSTGYYVDTIIRHSLYSSFYNNLEYNIALLRTSSQMIFSSSVRPVCLPSNGTEVKLGMHCIATGWGRMSGNHYQYGQRDFYQVRLPILDPDDCTTYDSYESLNDGLMCAGYLNRTETGICYGDQGGPLVCLIGKSSWVQIGMATSSSTCSMFGRPSIFVRTEFHKSWIEEVITEDYTIPVTPSPPSLECEETITFTTPSGTVTSPGYPSNYANNLNCEWMIVAPDDRVIEIIFNEVTLESQSSCNYDYLQIYDGQELYNGRKFCGKESPRDFAALSTSVRIVFHTGSSSTETGFSISWTTSARCQDDEYTCGNGACIPENQQCDGLLDCDAGDDEEECVHVSWNENEDCGKVAVAPTFTWDTRIVGGNEAVPGSYPWMAMLRYKDSSSFICGASIINNETLLTAAHCVKETTRSFQVIVGRHEVSGNFGEQVVNVKSVVSHSNYSENDITAGYDIAILKLEQGIAFNGTARPVCLPRSASGKYEIKTGKQCIATGWGHLSENHDFLPSALFQVRLPIVDKQMCTESYANASTDIGNNTICAGDLKKGGIDTCQGDSGGPLVCLLDDNNWYQIGITSFGSGCARSGYPGVYTTVSHYYQWIVQNIGEPPSPETAIKNSSDPTTSVTSAASTQDWTVSSEKTNPQTTNPTTSVASDASTQGTDSSISVALDASTQDWMVSSEASQVQTTPESSALPNKVNLLSFFLLIITTFLILFIQLVL